MQKSLRELENMKKEAENKEEREKEEDLRKQVCPLNPHLWLKAMTWHICRSPATTTDGAALKKKKLLKNTTQVIISFRLFFL